MTISTVGYIKFKTHAVHIARDHEDRIYCFKMTHTRCDLEIFDDQDLAADYILEPFATIVYGVNLEEE